MDRFARTLSLSASSMMGLTAGADGEGSTPGPTATTANGQQQPTGDTGASGQRATSQDAVTGNAAEAWHLPETAKGQHSASGFVVALLCLLCIEERETSRAKTRNGETSSTEVSCLEASNTEASCVETSSVRLQMEKHRAENQQTRRRSALFRTPSIIKWEDFFCGSPRCANLSYFRMRRSLRCAGIRSCLFIHACLGARRSESLVKVPPIIKILFHAGKKGRETSVAFSNGFWRGEARRRNDGDTPGGV